MWQPQKGPQAAAITARWADELFFGGARGGGKSDYQLGYQLDGAVRYGRNWRGIMFRKTFPQLEELQARARQIFGAAGAEYKTQPSADYPTSNCWYFSNGASVRMRYIEHERDFEQYQGHQYTGVSFDELTNYPTDVGYKMMLSCLRSAEGVPCNIRATGNPGGVGHIWVKARFVDIAPPMHPYTDPKTNLTRVFIPSRIQDNAILLQNDPTYINRLKGSGSDALVKAWLEGDWDIVAGAFFDCWNRQKHVIKPFKIPDDWPRFRSFDWGSAKPFSVGWWAVADGTTDLPRGALVRYREWYGMKDDEPNVGLKLTAEEVAEGIRIRDSNDSFAYSVADPSCWKVDGGPSIAERMLAKKVLWRRADNQRLNGWDQMRQRFIGEDGVPMIYCFETCTHSIRTIPLLQHDEIKPEDIDSDMEDHAADEWRYACMSRPWIPTKMKQDPKWPQGQTINELIRENRRRKEEA
jgi:hypothetical protein